MKGRLIFNNKDKLYSKKFKSQAMNPGDFQAIIQHLQRPINCLADQDRNIRKSGLEAIKKQMNTISKQNAIRLFNQTKLTSLMTKIASDKIQNNRQLGLEIVQLLIKMVGAQGKNIYEQLLPSLISRVNQIPYPQKSQDLRLKVVNIFIKLIPFRDCFLKHLPQLGSSIAKTLSDAYDQIKYSSCELVNKLSQTMPRDVGKYSLNMILSLRDNLKHQKFKVRKTALESVGNILVTDGAGGNFEQIKVGLKSVLSDKKQDVRVSAYQCVSHLILYLGPKYMKQYEAYLIGLLLMGLDDESKNIVDQVLNLLQRCGSKLKQEQGEAQTKMVDE